VRRAAAIGVSKVFYMNPELKNDLTLLDKLYAMIRDPDGNVVVNAIVALNEILESDGGIVLTDKLATYLLNRLNDYNECIQIVILDLLHGYSPK
jgi:vesicle coat complex subunit